MAVYKECVLNNRLQEFWFPGTLDPFSIKISLISIDTNKYF